MKTFLMVASLFTPGDDVATKDATDALAMLKRLAQPCATAKSYRFEMTQETSGGGGRRGAGGGSEARAPTTADVRVQAGKPLHVRSGRLEAFVADDKTVFRMGDGDWELAPTGPAFGGRRGGRRGGEDGEGGGGERVRDRAEDDAGSDREQMQRMMSLASLRTAKPPHVLLKNFDKYIEGDVTTEDKQEDVTTFRGRLTSSAASTLGAGGFGRRGRGGFGGEDMPEPTVEGTFVATTLPQGGLASFAIEIKTSTSFGDRDVERTRKTTYVIHDLGKVEIEVPEAALALLGAGEAADAESAPPARDTENDGTKKEGSGS